MKCNLSGPMIREVSVLSQSSPVQTRLTLQYLFFFFYQMVPRTLVGQGGREAADRERKERQLPGEREPESSGGFRPVGPHRRRQDGQQWQQTQSHSRHDPLPGKPSAHRLCVSSYLLSARDQSQTVLCDWPWQVDQSQMCPIPGNLISKSPDFWCMTPNFITTSRSPPEVTVLLYSSWFMTSLHTFMLCFFFLGMTVWNPVFGAVQRVVYCPAGNGEQKEILKQISMSLETKTYGSASNFPPSSRGIPVWARNFDLCSISQQFLLLADGGFEVCQVRMIRGNTHQRRIRLWHDTWSSPSSECRLFTLVLPPHLLHLLHQPGYFSFHSYSSCSTVIRG